MPGAPLPGRGPGGRRGAARAPPGAARGGRAGGRTGAGAGAGGAPGPARGRPGDAKAAVPEPEALAQAIMGGAAGPSSSAPTSSSQRGAGGAPAPGRRGAAAAGSAPGPAPAPEPSLPPPPPPPPPPGGEARARGEAARLLEAVAGGTVDPGDALPALEASLAALGGWRQVGDFARADVARGAAGGLPEAVFAAGKTPEQTARILRELARVQPRALATRVDPAAAAAVAAIEPAVEYHAEASCLTLEGRGRELDGAARARLAIVSAGTADRCVAAECLLTARWLGFRAELTADVGVAGLHRLLSALEPVRAADAVIVVAGMDCALPSVVAGLVAAPVVAVPTSTGYGAALGGVAALGAALNSCAAGMGVVNIDNGFGGAMLAARILKPLAAERARAERAEAAAARGAGAGGEGGGGAAGGGEPQRRG